MHTHGMMSNSKGSLELGVYIPNLVGEREEKKRAHVEKQIAFWKDKWPLGE